MKAKLLPGLMLLAWNVSALASPLQPDWELGQRLPADTVLYFSTAPLSDLRTAYEQSHAYQLWTKLPLPAEANVTSELDAKLSEALGLTSTELLTLFSGPVSVGLVDFDLESMKEGKAPPLIVRAGLGDVSLMSKLEPKLQAALVDKLGASKSEDWEGSKVQRYGDEGKPGLYTAITGSAFYLTTDADLLKRALAGPTVQSLMRSNGMTAAQEKLGREGELFVYINLKKAIAKIKPVVLAEGVQAAQSWATSGIESLNWIATSSSLRDGRFLDRCVLSLGSQSAGVVSLLSGMEAGPAESLNLLPQGTSIAVALNLEPFPKLLDRMLNFARKHGPPTAAQELEANLAEAGVKAGFDLRAQLLDLLGGEIALAARVPDVNPGVIDNPLLLGGVLPELRMTLIVELTDTTAFDKTLQLLLSRRELVPESADYKGNAIHTIQIPGAPVPVAYAYSGKWFILGPGSASVEQVLDTQAAGGGLSKSSDWSLLGADHPHLLSFTDLPRIAEVAGVVAVPHLKKMHPELDWAKLPAPKELASLLAPAVSVLQLDAQSWSCASYSPLGGLMSFGSGILTSIAVPSAMRAKAAAIEHETLTESHVAVASGSSESGDSSESQAAREATVLSHLRSIAGAQNEYRYQSNPSTFSDSLANLATGEGAGGKPLIDPALATGYAAGYIITLQGSVDSWSVEAHPEVYSPGARSFYTNESGIQVGGDNGGLPGTADLPEL